MSSDESPPVPTSPVGGYIAACGAFLFWGFVAPFWKALDHVDALEVMAHRVVWACACVVLVLLATKRLGEVRAAARSGRTVATLLLAALLLCANWYTFVWGVQNDRVLECSLGYFINPLFTMLLGRIFFAERLRPLQIAAVVLAASGVAYLTFQRGNLPWVSLVLAGSFGFYGLLRKRAGVEALPGLLIETALLSLPAIGILIVLGLQVGGVESGSGGAVWSHDAATVALLIAGGGVTALPLALFGYGMRRLPMKTMGFLQFIGPSGMFLLGVFVYGEESEWLTFILIWLGLALYITDTLLSHRARRT